MLLTQRLPDILVSMYDHYKSNGHNDRLLEALRDSVFHNNSPINILKAVTILISVQDVVDAGRCHQVEIEYCLRYLSELSGYSVIELNDRMGI